MTNLEWEAKDEWIVANETTDNMKLMGLETGTLITRKGKHQEEKGGMQKEENKHIVREKERERGVSLVQ